MFQKPCALRVMYLGTASFMVLNASVVRAQDTEQNQATQNNTIVVTAQKREEAIKDVPISIQVIDEETIEKEDLRNLQDYVDLIPALAIEQSSFAGGSGDVRIRGIGALGGVTNTWALYVDGFDVTGGSRGGASIRLADAERIEVLRGPQGTAFGRNVVAGAISITSETPDPGAISGRLAIDAGSNDTYGVLGSINVPLSDDAAIIASGFFDDTDGFVTNIGPAGGTSSQRNFGGRLAFFAEPTSRLQIKASIAYEESDFGVRGGIPDGDLFPTTAALIEGIVNQGLNPFFAPGDLDGELTEFFPDQNDTVSLNRPEATNSNLLTAILRLDYDFGDVSLISVSGYNRQERSALIDADSSEIDSIFTASNSTTEFVSTELRLQSNGDQIFDWVIGAYGGMSNSESLEEIFAGETIRNSTFIPGISNDILAAVGVLTPQDRALFASNQVFVIDTEPGQFFERFPGSFDGEFAAVFADGSFELTDRLTILGGLRYNYDQFTQRREEFIRSFALPDLTVPPGIFPDSLVPLIQGIRSSFVFPANELTVDSDALTWRVSSTYEFTDDLTAYATISTGYRPGGPQVGNVQVRREADGSIGIDDEGLAFEPERITNYEIGLKGGLFGNRAQFSLSAFRMDYNDIQFTVLDLLSGLSVTGNAEGRAQGVEFDFRASVSERFTLSGGLAYIDTEILDTGIAGDPRIGQAFPYAPEFSFTAIADYQRPISGDLELFARATYSFVDERNDQFRGTDDAEQVVLDSYNRLDLRIGLERPDNWRLEGFVENATDEIYATSSFVNGFSLNGSQFITPPGRQFGARFIKYFN
ncbi:MAG: TonB-dependent receptor [Pseudomonadota bacterium]